MQIIKYAGKTCIKCKVLDKVLEVTPLPVEVETIYVEDVGQDKFLEMGISTMPVLKLIEGEKEIVLDGAILPQHIQNAIAELQG